MGSDFTYEDLEKRSPERDNHRLIKHDTINGNAVWLVEAIPVQKEQYSKRKVWISKAKLIPLKVEFYDRDGELLKVLTVTKTSKEQGYWIIIRQVMKNVQKNHKTSISLSNVLIENGVTDSKFTQREMVKGL